MPRPPALLLAICAACLGFAVTYLANPPAPHYLPEARRWQLEKPTQQISMGWYGRSAWGLGAALVCGLAAWSAARKLRRMLFVRRLAGVATALALLALLALGVYVVSTELSRWDTISGWSRHPPPGALPKR